MIEKCEVPLKKDLKRLLYFKTTDGNIRAIIKCTILCWLEDARRVLHFYPKPLHITNAWH